MSSSQIEVLRRREAAGEPLSQAEKAELEAFYRRVEAREAVYLEPAVARLRRAREAQETMLHQLEALRERKQQYLEQFRTLAREIEAIGAEERRLLAQVSQQQG